MQTKGRDLAAAPLYDRTMLGKTFKNIQFCRILCTVFTGEDGIPAVAQRGKRIGEDGDS